MNSLRSITKKYKIMPHRLLLFVIVSFLTCRPAVAQQTPVQTTLLASAPTVTLTITADLEPTGERIPQLPTDVMERLSTQETLANFELRATGDSRIRLSARFLFPDLEALTRWQADEETQELMELLDGPGGLEYTLSGDRSHGRPSPWPLQQPDDR
jgi:hypothetical protein